jgi:hypothetical protein
MAKRKKTIENTKIYKTPHRKPKIEQHEPHQKPEIVEKIIIGLHGSY